MKFDKSKLESIYQEYNRREFVSPDPLQFLYCYSLPEDREIVALIASGLAYGRVAQILKSIKKILVIMGDSPAQFVRKTTEEGFYDLFRGFKHRFTTDQDLAKFLAGTKYAVNRYGSLEECFRKCCKETDANVVPALNAFASHLCSKFDKKMSYLFPAPHKGSACKRPMLFLRWLIRSDEVDPGGWDHLTTDKLIIPLDTHMHQFALKAGFTKRKNANLATAIEITEKFREICPEDPVKYDFAITRFGIRDELHPDHLHNRK